MATEDQQVLTPSELHLLRWLLVGEGTYGECKGAALDDMMTAGYVEWLPSATGAAGDYRRVQITQNGKAALAQAEVMRPKA